MSVIEINKDNFEQEIVESAVLVLIDFWAEWCGPCRMMKPVFEELSSKFGRKLKFAKVNVDENPELSSEFNVQGIPCLILTKKGKEINRIVGFLPKEQLKEKIEKSVK